MKTRVLSIAIMLGYALLGYGQESWTSLKHSVPSPDAYSFQKINAFKLKHYQGAANINIPLYEIKLGELQIPISLMYNTEGVRVNDIASSVGTNWTLSGIGRITKIVKDSEDYSGTPFFRDKFDTVPSSGWLYRKYTNRERVLPIQYFQGGRFKEVKYLKQKYKWNKFNDTKPDTYIVNAPGLHTKYSHKPASDAPLSSGIGGGGEVFELEHGNNLITENIGRINLPGKFKSYERLAYEDKYVDGPYVAHGQIDSQNGIMLDEILLPREVKIISAKGFEYYFDKHEFSQTVSKKASKLVLPGNESKEFRISENFNVESINLTKIKNLKTGEQVVFEYEIYRRDSYDPPFTYNLPYAYGQSYLMSIKYPKLQRLKRIVFSKGTVEFSYNLDRDDLEGDKALTNVVVKNVFGKVIKEYELKYGYFESYEVPSDTDKRGVGVSPKSFQMKRLKLLEVVQKFQGNYLPGYKFSYDKIKLPPRGIVETDFLGFSNGEFKGYKPHELTNRLKPIMYFYPDSYELSLLPFDIGKPNFRVQGDFSLYSNLTYCKAGILNKIKYPTGGTMELEYELNDFLLGGTLVKGGGLRVKSQKTSDGEGNSYILDYSYVNKNGKSSGRLNFMPYFGFPFVRHDKEYVGNLLPSKSPEYFLFTTQFNQDIFQRAVDVNEKSSIGYSRVVVKNRKNNGSTVYEYTSIEDFPMNYFKRVTNTPITTITQNQWDILRRNGYYLGGEFQGGKLGKLKTKKIYNSDDDLVFQLSNNYTYSDKIQINDPSYSLGPAFEKITKKASKILLKSSKETLFSKEGDNTSEIIYEYDPEFEGRGFPISRRHTDSKGNITIEKYLFGKELKDMRLLSQNRISEVTAVETFNNGHKVSSMNTIYDDFNGNYLKKVKQKAKGTGEYENQFRIEEYDSKGNVVKVREEKGNVIYNIWGYKGTELIGRIKGEFTLSILQKSKIRNAIEASNTADEKLLLEKLKSLSEEFENNPNVEIETFTHIPLIGLSSRTDRRGEKVTFHYDAYNRLQYVKDSQGNILKEHKYNYKN